MPKQNILEAFNAAIEGIVYVLKTQRNMRIHFLMAAMAIMLGIYMNFDGNELILLLMAIIFVLLSEMINTAIELTIDLISNEFHHLARIIKDIAAGAVLLASFNALITGYLLFRRHLTIRWDYYLNKIRETPWHVTIIILITVFALVVIAKVLFRKGTPLRGGMPSGHAALAFSIWTVIVFATSDLLVAVLTFLLAFLVARSRFSQNIHDIWEVFAGSILGVVTTTLILQVLR